MACIQDKECSKCGLTKPVDVHLFTGVCPECVKELADKERRMALAALKGLTVEERLERIEATLYDLANSLPQQYEPRQRVYR
jgi:hypothetical protein